MNRAQRRALERKQRRRKMGIRGEQQKNQPVTISYGVIKIPDGTFLVLLQFNQATAQIGLNDAQVDAMIASLQDVKGKLAAARAGVAP